MTTKLCVCNNCLTVMVDENPSDQPEFETDNIKISEMAPLQDEGGFYYGCPVCLVDDFLMDVVNTEQIEHAVI